MPRQERELELLYFTGGYYRAHWRKVTVGQIWGARRLALPKTVYTVPLITLHVDQYHKTNNVREKENFLYKTDF